MMKILFPIGSFYPAQEGGPDNSVYWLNQEANKRGVDTTVVSTMKGIKDASIKSGESIRKYGVRTYFFGYYGKHFICPGLYKWFLKNVKNYDLVHINSIFFPLSFIVALIAILKGTRFVVSPRGELDEGALYYGKAKKIFYIKLAKPIFTKASFFHATCENEGNQIKKYFGKDVKCFIIPNAIGNFEESFKEAGVHEKFGISKDDKYVLSLGRVSPKKVLENLITAFVDVVCDNVVLIIAGDPENPYGRELKRLALELGLSERVKFIGPVRGNIKESLYSNAEILVLPSHTENFGNVVIEALNRGLPVIASKGTPWQVLEDSQCGFWVENNPEDLSKTITEFLNMDSKLKMIYRENAKELVKDRFTTEVVWKEYLNMYNRSTTNVK